MLSPIAALESPCVQASQPARRAAHARFADVIQSVRQRHACGCEGVGWGSIDCLLPTQSYRVALSNPPVESLYPAAPSPPTPMAAPRLENIGLDDGFESARRRRQQRQYRPHSGQP